MFLFKFQKLFHESIFNMLYVIIAYLIFQSRICIAIVTIRRGERELSRMEERGGFLIDRCAWNHPRFSPIKDQRLALTGVINSS